MKIGIIGGSGLYELEGLLNLEELRIDTPFGAPSDSFMAGQLDAVETVFMPRHGRGHRLLPHEIPFRANIWGMKQLGVTHLISVSAVGSLREEIKPGDMVFPDQFIDRTHRRASTFFGEGAIAHIQFADPVCPMVLETLSSGAAELGIVHHRGGTYICMEGPAFSTRAESHLYRSWGGAVIGMTNLTEAKLAREAEICFATIALATDFDCWHETEEDVSVEGILAVMASNVATTKKLIGRIIGNLEPGMECPCHHALQDALLTPPGNIPLKVQSDLQPIIGRYVRSSD